MLKKIVGLAILVALLAATPMFAQTGVSTARGTVKDQDGNPVVGAVVTFAPRSDPNRVYNGTSNKKGRYDISGMFSTVQGDMWTFSIAVEGDRVGLKATVELRSGGGTLTGDIQTIKLRPGQTPELPIRPLGSATIHFVVGEPEEVVATQTAEGGAAPARKVDPWAAALTAAQDGDYEDSVPFFEEAIEDEPDDAERHKAFAQVLYQMEDLDRAETVALEAIELAPEAIDSRMVLYSVYVARGDMGNARTTLEGAKEVDPANKEVLRQVAFVAGESGDAAAEIDAYEQIVAADPGDVESWLNLGALHAKAGDQEKSTAAYEQVIALDPSNAHQVFFNLGALQVNAGNTDKAVAAFRQALEVKPDYAMAHKELAFALIGMGERAEAAKHLEEYVKLSPNASDASSMQAIIDSLK